MGLRILQSTCFILLSVVLNLALFCSAWQSRSNFDWTIRFKSRTRTYSSPISQLEKSDAKTLLQPKIPKTAWRWPLKWPFQDEQFSLVPEDKRKELTAIALEGLCEHVDTFLGDSSNVLEISVLPFTVFKSSDKRTVTKLNLDNRLTKLGVDDAIPYADATFDSVVFSSGIELVENPRDLYCEIWRVLKPGGKVISSFSSSKTVATLPVKIWTTTTDDQKIWVAGRYLTLQFVFTPIIY